MGEPSQYVYRELIMSSNSITTIVKMVESLPDELQDRVVEQVRTYIADLEEEAKWEKSFKHTPASLVAVARQAKREIVEGKSTPMDYDQL
jgi:translation initiation factor 2B subunit (eIF-2B alpha/beta/delta family)